MTDVAEDAIKARKEMDALRKRRLMSLALAESGSIPDPGAFKHIPHFTAKELSALHTIGELPKFKSQAVFRASYQKTVSVDGSRHPFSERYGNRRPHSSITPRFVTEDVKVTDFAIETLKDNEGAVYFKSVETTACRLKERELLVQERYLVEGEARMAMIQVKRENEADNMKEALQEWIGDARLLVNLHDKDSYFSIVSKIHEDEEEKKEGGDGDKKVDPEITSLSFSTNFNGREYTIAVEMPNETDVRVQTYPYLHGVEKRITEILSTCSLLDAVTTGFWKMAAARA